LITQIFCFLVLQIRKNNIFLYVTSQEGKLIVLKSAGNCGFKDKKKLTLETFSMIANSLVGCLNHYRSLPFLFKIDGGLKQDFLFAILALFAKLKLKIIGILFQSKISFNGCKLKIK